MTATHETLARPSSLSNAAAAFFLNAPSSVMIISSGGHAAPEFRALAGNWSQAAAYLGITSDILRSAGVVASAAEPWEVV